MCVSWGVTKEPAEITYSNGSMMHSRTNAPASGMEDVKGMVTDLTLRKSAKATV